MTAPAIALRGVSKQFRLRAGRGQWTLKSAFVDLFRRRPLRSADRFEALHDIDLTVMRGQSLGIIGENGSGKSTLLKLIAKIYRPDAGTVHVEGRLAALIELGAGFHPEFTGRENIVIGGMLLGLSRREVLERLDDIIAFADIGEFIDQPARTYSSGMFMRLGFSVAVQLDPDVLLIDEALAVGDEAFAKKCGERIAGFRGRGRTIVLVSHDLEAVERWCDTAIWLGGGAVRASGTPTAVIAAYHRALALHEVAPPEAPAGPQPVEVDHRHTLPVAIAGLRLTDRDDVPRGVYRAGEMLKAALTYRVGRATRPGFGFEIVRADGLCVYGARLSQAVPDTLGETEIEITIDSLDLVGGAYFFNVTAYSPDGQPGDRHQRRYPFRVSSDAEVTGVARLRHRWRVVEAAER